MSEVAAETIWWCDLHNHQAIWVSPEDGTGFCCRNGRLPSGGIDCVLVVKRLADPDALIVGKVDEEWPEWLVGFAVGVEKGFDHLTAGRFSVDLLSMLDIIQELAAASGEDRDE